MQRVACTRPVPILSRSPPPQRAPPPTRQLPRPYNWLSAQAARPSPGRHRQASPTEQRSLTLSLTRRHRYLARWFTLPLLASFLLPAPILSPSPSPQPTPQTTQLLPRPSSSAFPKPRQSSLGLHRRALPTERRSPRLSSTQQPR